MERQPQYNDDVRGLNINFSVHGEDRQNENIIAAGSQEIVALNDGWQQRHFVAPAFQLAEGFDAQIPVMDGAPIPIWGPADDGVLPEQAGEPGSGIGADNHGGGPVLGGAPRFEIGAGNDGETAPGFGIGAGNNGEREAGFGIGAGNNGERAPGFGIGAVTDGGRAIQGGALRSGNAVHHAGMRVPAEHTPYIGILRVTAEHTPYIGILRAIPPSGILEIEFEPEDEIEDDDEISEEEAVNVAAEILERVCESIELDELDVEEEQELLCVICIEALNYVDDDGNGNRTLHRLPCSHVFHTHCISQWLRIKLSCPICRTRLRLP